MQIAARGESADRRRPRHDPRESDAREMDQHEGRSRQRGRLPSGQRLLAHAPDRVRDDGDDHGLETVENRPHQLGLAVSRSDPRQDQHAHGTGQHEQRARRHAAPRPVQAPADIGGELLRFGSRQQRGEGQAAQERRLADPALPIDQLGLHHRDLAGRPAERQAAELEPIDQRFLETRLLHVKHPFVGRTRRRQLTSLRVSVPWRPSPTIRHPGSARRSPCRATPWPRRG